jgi:hypothetical protein
LKDAGNPNKQIPYQIAAIRFVQHFVPAARIGYSENSFHSRSDKSSRSATLFLLIRINQPLGK